MKGVILCGGLGTRLYPVTRVINKHLLPVYDKPMVYYPINTLLRAGIEEILIVTGGPHANQFSQILRDGKELGIPKLAYVNQPGLGGAGEALGLAEQFAQGQPVVVMLGDYVCDSDVSQGIKNYSRGGMVFLQKYLDPEGMGVPVFDQSGKRILRIEENPDKPLSEYAVIGIYIYDCRCFDFVRDARKNVVGEIKPTHINNRYLELGELNWIYLPGFGTDAGKFDRLLVASQYFSKNR